MWLIVGLGNPGEQYDQTRHNIGFRCVQTIGQRHGLKFDSKRNDARIAEGSIDGQRVVLARPQTFMNLSGHAVSGLVRWYKIDPARAVLIIFDELDLPFATLRLREKGSAGTHNGMKSVVAQLGSQEVPRLRVGVGPTPPGWDTSAYVLGRFNREEAAAIPALCDRVADTVDTIVRDGITLAMSRMGTP